MNLNLLDLLNQIKKFASQEKGDLFSLFTYILMSLVLMNWYFGTPLSKVYESYNSYIVLGVFALCFIIRFRTRRIDTVKNKINIGISQFSVLNVSVDKIVDAEQKLTISNEIANYIYNALNHQKQSFLMDPYLNFFRLPSRLRVNYANCDKIINGVGTDFLIWGTTSFSGDKLFINYKVCFKKRINSIFFDKLINDINAYPDVPFSFSQSENLECNKFIHMVTYLSIIYKGIELMNSYKYSEAEDLLNIALNRLNKLYVDESDKSVNAGDKDMVKIEILMQHVLIKNYLNRAHAYLESFDASNEANKKLELCSIIADKQVKMINKYLKSKKQYASHFEEMALENEYIYTLGQLGKTRDKAVINTHLKKVSRVIKSKYKFDLIKGFVEVIFKDFAHAKSSYENALTQNPENVVALRSLGVLYYNLGDYKKASAYLHKLDSISFFHIFQSNLYDIKRQKMLFKIDLGRGNILGALRHLYRVPLFMARNARILDKVYVL